MTCSLCSMKGHNRRGCPNKDSTTATEQPPTKKEKDRPRKDATATPIQHHNQTAQPRQLGRNGRLNVGGVGAKANTGGRGGGPGSRDGRDVGRGSRGGRGRPKVPKGAGVFIGDDGTAYSNPTGGCGPTQIGTQSSHA